MSWVDPHRLEFLKARKQKEERARFRRMHANLAAGRGITPKDKKFVCYHRRLAGMHEDDEVIQRALETYIASWVTERLLK